MKSIRRFLSRESHRMSWIGIAAVSLTLLIAAGGMQDSRLSKYKRIEGYLIRPGVLLFPRYSEDGQLCEAELESVHFNEGKVILSPGLTPGIVEEITDELAPPAERGDPLRGAGNLDVASFGGGALVTYRDYTNLSVRTYTAVTTGSISDMKQAGDPVAVLVWKNRRCK